MNQSQVFICPLPFEPPSHPPPHPVPLGCHRALGWAPCVTQQIPTGYLAYIWWGICFHATFSIHHTLSIPTVSSSLFSMSASSLLPHKYVHQHDLSRFYTYALICNICLSLSDLLCAISSRFIHLIRTNSNVLLWASLVAQRLKRLPPMWETQVRSLGWKDPLEKEMVIHSSILAWRIPWTEEPGRLQSTGSQRVRHDWATSLSLSIFHCIYVPQFLYPFICQWISRLLPCPKYWKQANLWQVYFQSILLIFQYFSYSVSFDMYFH